MSLSKFAESGNINKFVIHSNDGTESIDVSAAVATLFYYESVLENTIKITAVLADTGYTDKTNFKGKGLIDGLKLQGAEKVYITFEDNFKNKVAYDTDSKALYINTIRDVITRERSRIFTVDLCTQEFLKNELLETRVEQRYDGKISDIVNAILTTNLSTKKKVIVDSTLNSEIVFGRQQRPLELCTILATRGIPSDVSNAQGKTAGYLFFETSEGMQFRSIDSILKPINTSQIYKYIYTGSTKFPPGYAGNILDYTENFYINVQQKMRSGTWGVKLEFYDYLAQEYQTEEITAKDQKKVAQNAGNEGLPDLGIDFNDKPTARIFSPVEKGTVVSGTSVNDQLENTDTPNIKVEDVLSQAKMRYNQLFTMSLDITVPGNYALHAGTLVKCDFKEISSSSNSSTSERLSGIYMIADLCHFLTPKETFTKLRIVRDSYGSKFPP
jgi:hypothetical protein